MSSMSRTLGQEDLNQEVGHSLRDGLSSPMEPSVPLSPPSRASIPSAAWQPIEGASRDGTPIFAESFDGFRLLAKWADGFLNDEGGNCGCWVAVEEDIHPADWTDGVCWASNEDGNPSDPLVRFINIADIATAAVSKCVYKLGSDNYARVHQGAFLGAKQALLLFASGIETEGEDPAEGLRAEHESPIGEAETPLSHCNPNPSNPQEQG